MCRGAQKTRVLHRASCVSPQISLASASNIHHPVSVRFLTPSDPLFSTPLQYLGLCSLAFRSRTFERGTRISTCICADTIIYTFTTVILLQLRWLQRARIHGWEGVVSMGRVVACSFLFIASFRYKIASNYSVGFTGIYSRRVVWEYVSRILVDLWVVASWGGKIGRVWTIILVYFEIKFIFCALLFLSFVIFRKD